MLKEFARSTLAGMLVAMAAGLLVKVGLPLGGLTFPLALVIISAFSLTLFTGWVSVTWDWLMLAGNAFGSWAGGLLIRLSDPAVQIAASQIMESKISYEPYQLFIKGILCGILMCMAFFSGRRKESLALYLAVAGFVLAGFEHSIAFIAYAEMASAWTGHTVFLLLVILAGNAIGAKLAFWLMTGGSTDGN